MRAALAALLLVLAAGCRPEPAAPVFWEAWETGRTMVFEMPVHAGPRAEATFNNRFQKQVQRSEVVPGGRKVEMRFTTFGGQRSVDLLLKGGGVALADGQGRTLPVLPEGFPDRAGAWTTPFMRCKVLGRARWERPGAPLPPGQEREGVWVEAEVLQGEGRIRVLYLPDLGEVERREFDGTRWVTTQVLVGVSYQELPR